MELTPGLALGEQFVLVRRVADGGSSQVWLAEDRELGRRVALKVFDPRTLDAPGALARLEVEVQRARSLPPGLAVEILGLHEAAGLTLLEMEYLPGGDLGQFRGRSFPVFARALAEVTEALAAAHERGFVHRDLKCANVLLDDSGRARLADFGLAALAGAASGGGSPYNMSPQQLRGEPAAPSDDLYAFGAMLYELLAGHPPYYPDVTRERVLHDPVPPLVPRTAAPERVRELALRLLSKSPATRPASMEEVKGELAAALAEPTEEALGAAARTGNAAVRQPEAEPKLEGWFWQHRPMVAAIAVVIIGLAFVFLWLPERVAQRTAATSEEAAAEALAAAGRAKRQQQDETTWEQARVAATQARDAYAARLASIEQQAAAAWATGALAAARTQGDAAARSFELLEYAAARDGWGTATAALDAIDAGRPAALSAALRSGNEAMSRGQAGVATEAFQLALSIEPGNAGAERGLRRAGNLDAVFGLLDQAARDEQAGRIASAREAYRKALELDSEAPGAQAALERIAAQQAGEAFAAVMSRGLTAMADGRTEAARAAFREAGAMRPGSQEVKDALAELDGRQQASGLQVLVERALAAERTERWDAARQAWSDALAIDPGLAPARAGLDRVTPRVQLDARIDLLIREPQRLWTQSGRAEAASAIAAAADAAPPRDMLAPRAERLAMLLRLAEMPVRVEFQSDGVTEVVIYRVGQFGAFQRQHVDLLPGRYAVVGTRPGFRDVRREIEVLPGVSPGPVSVRCEERI